jgi:tRNA dimethylallyltransferase
MQELGLEYRYMALHLTGKISKEEMLSQLETAIWHYAKRQKTWFKRNKEINWIDPRKKSQKIKIEKITKIFLTS